ncbi:hypothetical protein FRX31_003089, partial [Thalictrum thalictroides]
MEGPSEPRPSDEAYESDDDNDREFIMKTKEVDDDENEERPEELRLERNMTWDQVIIMPPIKRKGPGRNRKQRRIDAYEAELTGRRRNDKRC